MVSVSGITLLVCRDRRMNGVRLDVRAYIMTNYREAICDVPLVKIIIRISLGTPAQRCWIELKNTRKFAAMLDQNMCVCVSYAFVCRDLAAKVKFVRETYQKRGTKRFINCHLSNVFIWTTDSMAQQKPNPNMSSDHHTRTIRCGMQIRDVTHRWWEA